MNEGELKINLGKSEKINFILHGIDDLLNFKEEIPERMIDGSQEDKEYKVRTNWFAGITNLVTYAIHQGILPQEFELKILELIKNFKARHTTDEVRTTREEIEAGNNILNMAKEYIEKNK